MEICIQFFKTDATTFTLRSLPCDLRAEVYFSAPGRSHVGLIAPYRTGCGGESGWDAFFALSRTLTTRQVRRLLLTSILRVFRAYYLTSGESSPLSDFINPEYSAADRKAWRTGMRGVEVNIKSEGRKINCLRTCRCFGPTPPLERAPLESVLTAEQPLSAIGLLACGSGPS